MHWRLIISLSLVSFAVGADEFALSPLLGLIGEDLAVEPARVAWFVTAYALPFSLLAPVFGSWSDRRGRKRILVPALLVFASANIGLAQAASFESGIAWRLLAGVGAAGILSNVFAWVSDAVPRSQQPRAMGCVQLGLTLGLILSPAAGAWIATVGDWRLVFLVIGGLALAAVVALAALPAPEVDDEESVSFLAALSRPGIAGGLAAHALGLGVAVGCYALLGQLLHDRFAMTAAAAGLILGGFGLATVAGNGLTGLAAARLGSPFQAARAGLLLVAAAVGSVFLFGQLPLLLMLGLLALWAIAGGWFAPSQQTDLAQLAGNARGTVLALAGSAMNLAVASTTAIAPILYGIHGPWSVGALALGAFSIAIWMQSRAHPAADRRPRHRCAETS